MFAWIVCVVNIYFKMQKNNLFVIRVMTQAEWDSLPGGLLDQGVVDGARSVCQPALLHCM